MRTRVRLQLGSADLTQRMEPDLPDVLSHQRVMSRPNIALVSLGGQKHLMQDSGSSRHGVHRREESRNSSCKQWSKPHQLMATYIRLGTDPARLKHARIAGGSQDTEFVAAVAVSAVHGHCHGGLRRAPRRVRYAERHASQDVKPLKSKCLDVGSPSSMIADRPPATKSVSA